MPDNNDYQQDDEQRVKVLSITALSVPTYAVYHTRPEMHWVDEEGKPYPVNYQPLAMWALIEIDSEQHISGVELNDVQAMRFCAEASNLLGYLTSNEPMDERQYVGLDGN